jgi:signal recognition particle subunit SEC65
LIRTALFLALTLSGGATQGVAAVEAAKDCPPTFEAFARRFMDDPAFQRAHVADSVIDQSENSEGSSSRRVPRSKLKWPLMETTADVRRERLQMTVERDKSNPGRWWIILHRPESDAYEVSYSFVKRGCWALRSRVDNSE